MSINFPFGHAEHRGQSTAAYFAAFVSDEFQDHLVDSPRPVGDEARHGPEVCQIEITSS
ncbi:MAG: hypothetical protein ACPGVG_19415 [Mycobacterium sp.]